jgi:hypothetical protein
MWFLLQALIFFAVMASNFAWHWTSNPYVAAVIGVGHRSPRATPSTPHDLPVEPVELTTRKDQDATGELLPAWRVTNHAAVIGTGRQSSPPVGGPPSPG